MAGSQAKIKKDTKEIDEHYISGVVATVARIPVDSVKETEKFKLKNLDLTLKKEIFGQNDAIDKVVDNIIYTRSNILNREKPIGSFLFAGPSGVGKTELAKQLQEAVDRLNCSDIIFCTDIAGGTPFNQSVILSTHLPNSKVISGTNVPVLLEALFSRANQTALSLSEILVDSHQSRIQVFQSRSQNKKNRGSVLND